MPPWAVTMDTIRLQKGLPKHIESMSRLAVAAFIDDPLLALYWPPSLRVGFEEVAIEARVDLYHNCLTEEMKEGYKFVVAVEGEKVVGWAQWQVESYATELVGVAEHKVVDLGHMVDVTDANEEEFTSSARASAFGSVVGEDSTDPSGLRFLDLVAYGEIESVLNELQKRVCSGLGNGKFLVLKELAVAPQYQGRHIGKRLVQWVLQDARIADHRTIVVIVDHNLGFYQRVGFKLYSSMSVRGLPMHCMVAK